MTSANRTSRRRRVLRSWRGRDRPTKGALEASATFCTSSTSHQEMKSANQTSRRQRVLRSWRGRDRSTEASEGASKLAHMGHVDGAEDEGDHHRTPVAGSCACETQANRRVDAKPVSMTAEACPSAARALSEVPFLVSSVLSSCHAAAAIGHHPVVEPIQTSGEQLTRGGLSRGSGCAHQAHH